MKYLSWIITVPLTVIAIVFAVSNRAMVTLDLWPLELTVRLPLFLLVLGSLLLGLLVGGFIAWLSGAGRRRRARQAGRRAAELEREVARLRQAEARPSAPLAPPTAGSVPDSGARVPARFAATGT